MTHFYYEDTLIPEAINVIDKITSLFHFVTMNYRSELMLQTEAVIMKIRQLVKRCYLF